LPLAARVFEIRPGDFVITSIFQLVGLYSLRLRRHNDHISESAGELPSCGSVALSADVLGVTNKNGPEKE
jgi:hypothetical protein